MSDDDMQAWTEDLFEAFDQVPAPVDPYGGLPDDATDVMVFEGDDNVIFPDGMSVSFIYGKGALPHGNITEAEPMLMFTFYPHGYVGEQDPSSRDAKEHAYHAIVPAHVLRQCAENFAQMYQNHRGEFE